MRQTATLVVEIIETPGVLALAELVEGERDTILDTVLVVRVDEIFTAAPGRARGLTLQQVVLRSASVAFRWPGPSSSRKERALTTHTLTINGEKVTITQESVLLAAADARPNVRPRRHGVLIGSVLWAPKDLLRTVIGNDDLGNVDSPRAMKSFDNLGFQTFTETVYTADGLPFVHPENQLRTQEGVRP